MTNGIAPAVLSNGMTFGEWLARVLTRWRMVALIAFAVVAAAIAITFIAHPIYRGRASFLAIPNSGSRLSSGLASIAGASGFAQSLGIGVSGDPTTSPQFYQQLIMSRELLTRLATAQYANPRQRGGQATATLVELLGPDDVPDPRKRLEMTLTTLEKGVIRAIPDTKTNLITVWADTRWPALSAALANHVTALVDSFNVEQRQSRARARRVFADARVTNAQATLRAAEDRLRDFQQTNRQWQQSAELTFEQGRLRRQVEIEGELYLTLRRELETSRLDEVNDTPVITVVDSAVVPVMRQWPKRTSITIAAAFIGLFLGVLVAGSLVLVAGWAERNPQEAAGLRMAVDGVVRAIPGARRRQRAAVADDR